MVGVQPRLEDDVVINPFSWNAIVLRNGAYFSVNHYHRGISCTTGKSLPERFEFRYELQRIGDWANQKMDPLEFGVTFDSRGYAK